MILWCFYFALLVYNILDVYYTKLFFELGGYEGNPILGYFMNTTTDIQTIIIIKSIIFIFLGILVFLQNKKEKERYEKLSLNI